MKLLNPNKNIWSREDWTAAYLGSIYKYVIRQFQLKLFWNFPLNFQNTFFKNVMLLEFEQFFASIYICSRKSCSPGHSGDPTLVRRDLMSWQGIQEAVSWRALNQPGSYPAICLQEDWNVLTKPLRANQQKLVKIEEESTIGQLLKLWAKVKIPKTANKNIVLTWQRFYYALEWPYNYFCSNF